MCGPIGIYIGGSASARRIKDKQKPSMVVSQLINVSCVCMQVLIHAIAVESTTTGARNEKFAAIVQARSRVSSIHQPVEIKILTVRCLTGGLIPADGHKVTTIVGTRALDDMKMATDVCKWLSLSHLKRLLVMLP